MRRCTARKGTKAGRDFWGCSKYPIDRCPGTIDIPPTGWESPVPGAFAQRQFEVKRRSERLRMRALLPLMTALFCLLAFGSFLLVWQWLGWAAGAVAMVVCIVGMIQVYRMPPESLYWRKGWEGERKTAEVLDPLIPQWFVILYGKQMPDGRGDIDAIAVGPSGVWVIETKSLSGEVSIFNERIFVAERDRQAMVAQVYREAFAVQQIVGELLAPTHNMVTPVLCIHRARLPFMRHSVGGVRVVSGRDLRSCSPRARRS